MSANVNLHQTLLEDLQKNIEFYSSEKTTSSYLEAVNCSLTKYLKDTFEEDFLYCSILHVDKLKNVTSTEYKFGDDESTAYDYFKELIKALINQINLGNSVSVTRLLTENNKNRTLNFSFCHESEPTIQSINFIQTFDLQKISNYSKYFVGHNREIDNFFNLQRVEPTVLDEDLFKSLFELYQEQAPSIPKIKNLILSYKEIALISADLLNRKNTYFYFIRPYNCHSEYSGVLYLALHCCLDIDEYNFFELIVYRIISEVLIREVEKLEKLKSLQNLSISAHAIKTGINGLLSPPLNSLGQKLPANNDVQAAIIARDRVLAFAEIINVMSKLSGNGNFSSNDWKEILLKSKLFFHRKEVSLSSMLNTLLTNWNKDKHKTEIIWVNYKEIRIANDFLKFDDLTPTDFFYDLLLLTIIENCNDHGDAGNFHSPGIELSVEYSDKQITFRNKAANDKECELTESNTTGNIQFLMKIINELKIGNLKCTVQRNKKKEPIFWITIKSN